MSDWTPDQLATIGAADELQVTTVRPNGLLRAYATIWVVRVGDDLYVRSWRGRGGAWFRAVQQRPEGRIRAGGIERDVTFEEAGDADPNSIDQAYRTKYARYARTYVDPMVAPAARAATLRLFPRQARATR